MADKNSGWKCTHSASTTSTSNTSVTIKVTCYWKNNGWTYDINYVSAWVYCKGSSKQVKNSGSVNANSSTSQQVSMGSASFTINKTTATQTASCYGKITTNSSYVKGTKSSSATSISIPAKPSYKITYNANGGSGAPGQQTKWYGTNITLSSTKPTRTGHTFVRWNTNTSNTGTAYNPGATYSSNANLTLYAIWKANTYTVSYNANGGSGAPGSQTKTYGVNLTLSGTRPTRTNYNFLGWSTSVNGSVSYQPSSTYTNNSSVTLYAVWQLAYVAPRISNIQAIRCTSDGTETDEGTYLKVKFNWSTDRAVTAAGVQWYTNNTWTNYQTVSVSGTSGSVNAVLGGNWSTEVSYNIRIYMSDSGGTTYSAPVVLSSTQYIIDIKSGGTGIAFGKVAEKSSYAEFNLIAEFNKKIHFIEGAYVHTAKGTSGQHGYINFARITISGQYQNVPIKMTIVQRGRSAAVDLYICFQNNSGIDPALAYFRYFGLGYNLFIVKASTSVWDVYIQKSEAYDSISVIDYSTNLSYMSSIHVDWVDYHVNSLPSGYTTADNLLTHIIHNHAYDTTAGGQRFNSTWIGFYANYNDAMSGANRKGWIGHNNTTHLYIRNESTGYIDLSSSCVRVKNDASIVANKTDGTASHLIGISSANNVYVGDSGNGSPAINTNIYAGEQINFSAERLGAVATIINIFREQSGNSRTVLRPMSNGGAYIGTTTFRWNTAFFTNSITASDLKEKKILDLDIDTKSFIMGLKPIAYNRIGPGDTGKRIHMGFGAQQVNELLKSLGMNNFSIVQAAIKSEEGEDSDKPYYGEDIDDEKISWGLNYTEFIPQIVSFIQNLQNQVDELQQLVYSLKNQLNNKKE